MTYALLLVVLLPLAGAAINGIRAFASPKARKNRTVTNAVAIGATALSALIATFGVVMPYIGHGADTPFEHSYYTWIPAGMGQVTGGFLSTFDVDFSFRVDPLSCVMLMVVTWVGFLIHVYATGYMSHEEGYTRFFTYLNLFMFMMLLLILGGNYMVLFVGWEGVGLCSYLLIGFYYDKNFAADAGKKAFIVNRIGDFGFLLGIFLIFNTFGSADFSKVFALAAAGGVEQYGGIATAICLLLFVGACGKSAQLPLYVWLPDAMAGPTPVSALIHAATMVTAGVYMVVRSNVLFRLSPTAMMVVAIVGGLTALFAATIGIAQNDIKKVLAYSTVSQLGFMFIGAGVGGFVAAIFHLVTHAFFKACLFLGSGSVIHAMGGEQDIRKMGGLREHIPVTYWTFLIATIAIAGFPPFAGFFSKDEILASAWSTPYFRDLGRIIYVLGTIAALFTAFYMYRLVYLVFYGKFRGTHEQEHHLHESPPTMTIPLIVLGALSVVGGFLGIPHVIGHLFGIHHFLAEWLETIFPEVVRAHEGVFEIPGRVEVIVMIVSTLATLLGWQIARALYRERGVAADQSLEQRRPGLIRTLANKYYIDEVYDTLI